MSGAVQRAASGEFEAHTADGAVRPLMDRAMSAISAALTGSEPSE